MAVFRVPYPSDPERRRSLFQKALAKFSGHGTCDGDHDAGTFQGASPIGDVVGRYRAEPGGEELEVEILKKPFFVPLTLIESEARKFVQREMA
jgi:hypothetical protein